MGRMHYRCWKEMDGVEVVAICDANERIEEDTKKAAGNMEGAADFVDFGRLEVYTDFDEMLSKGSLDAVSNTLPTFMHAESSIKALQSGVHVLCEKPMALHLADCDRMIDAAKACGKVLQIGHCVRFWPEYAWAKRAVMGGQYGGIVAGTFQRLSKAPLWAWNNWFMDEDRSGGVVLDLHIHDTDFILYLLGKPGAVSSRAAGRPGRGMAHVVTQYLYDKDMAITAEGSWCMMPSFDFEMSFNLLMEKATLVFDCTRDPVFRVCPEEGDAFNPEVGEGDGYAREIAHFHRRILGEEVEAVATLEGARDAIEVSLAIRESARTGGKVVLA